MDYGHSMHEPDEEEKQTDFHGMARKNVLHDLMGHMEDMIKAKLPKGPVAVSVHAMDHSEGETPLEHHAMDVHPDEYSGGGTVNSGERSQLHQLEDEERMEGEPRHAAMAHEAGEHMEESDEDREKLRQMYEKLK